MSKKSIFLIILLTVFSFLAFNSEIIEKVEAVTTWNEATCSFSDNTWACYNDVMVSCTAAKCANVAYGADKCDKACIARTNASPDSTNCVINPVALIGTCSCTGIACTGETGTCTINAGSTCDYTCLANYGNCDGDNVDGCEADLNTDPNNCSYCGQICPSGTCISGVCTALVSPPTVSTNAIDEIYSYGVVLTGFISNTGGANATLVGVDYKKSSDSSWLSVPTRDGSIVVGSIFRIAVNDLDPYTDYDFRAKARNSAGWSPDANIITRKTLLAPNLHGFAWSEKIGWISFNGDNCDVNEDGKYKGSLEGAPSGCPSFGIAHPYGVYSSDGSLNSMRGFAWSQNIGWIKLATVTDVIGPSGNCMTWAWIRACAGNPNSECFIETASPNPEAGGWSGYICLEGAGTMDFYKVWLEDVAAPDPDEYEGWAWGGGGNTYCKVTGAIGCSMLSPCDLPGDPVINGPCISQSAIIGWISFNCADGGYNEGTGGYYSVCGTSDYKVTYEPVNEPPVINSVSSPIDHCAFDSPAGDRVNDWTTLTIKFDFSDDDAQTYEIYLDDEPISDPPLNEYFHVERDVTDSSGGIQEYKFKWTDNDSPVQPWPASGLNELAWAPQTYYYKVCITDSANQRTCSGDDFTMNLHASPYVNFTINPERQAAFKPVNFCSINGGGPSPDGVCVPASINKPPTDPTVCYDDLNNPDLSKCTNWLWTFELGDPGNSSLKNPFGVKFQIGPTRLVTLQVTDSSTYLCRRTDEVTIGLPLPLWREISPSF